MTSVNTRALTGDIDEECDMQGEGHLLSNHVDIIATINNTIKHFLYVKSFCDEQKICLNLVRQGQDVFAILPTGSGESLIFQLFSLIMNVIKGKVAWRVNFHNPHHCTSRNHNEIPSSSDLEKHQQQPQVGGRRKAWTKAWQCGESVRSLIQILWKPRKPKKILFESF